MSFDSRLYAMLSNQKISAIEMKMENKCKFMIMALKAKLILLIQDY